MADKTGGARIVSAVELKNIIETEMNNRPKDFENLYISTVEVCLPYIFGYKTEFFPSKTIPKI